MTLIRPATLDDCAQLVQLASKVGTGMTTVSDDPVVMKKRVLSSISAFSQTPEQWDKGGSYLLVMVEDEKIIGMCAIYTRLGAQTPFYTFRVSRLQYNSENLSIRTEPKTLTLVNDFHGYSEIGTLFLDPDYRKGGRGRFLSYSRFALVATNIERFGRKIMAEMRGWTDESGASPFWNAVGAKFFGMEFAQADRLSGVDNSFITELMPRSPIYLNILPQSAQDVVGVTHDWTRPARALLEKQGFCFESQIDIFDGAPCLETRAENVPIIAGARPAVVRVSESSVAGGMAMVCKPELSTFAVMRAEVKHHEDGVCEMSAFSAKTLGVNDGDTILVLPWG